MAITRREALGSLTLMGSAALLGLGRAAHAQDGAASALAAATTRGVAPGKHQPLPLGFDPQKLNGLSERLLVSHHDNNYAGAVKNLNAVEEELAKVNKDTPGFLVAGLRERELSFTNSMVLHELYFGNLGGDGKPGGDVQQALATAYGGFPRFEELWRATALSLAGGSGWAIVDLNFQSGDLRTYASGNHTQSLAFGAPLLVLDMYEHAYHLDYGAAAAKYVDAFWTHVKWDEVARRYTRALKAAQALAG